MKIRINAIYGPYIVVLGTLLNIASIIVSLISKNHKEPYLAFVPVSYIYWIIVLFFTVLKHDQNEISGETQYSLIYRIFAATFTFLALLSIMTNLAMIFVLGMKGIIS